MDWLLEYLDLVVPVTLVILFLLQRVFGTGEEQAGPRPGDPELDEEARRVQEEIRRKIVARQQGKMDSEEPMFPFEEPPPAPTAQAAPPWHPLVESPEPEPEVFVPPPAPRQDLLEELKQQRERVRQAKKQREEALRQSGRGSRKQPIAVVRRRPTGSLRQQLLSDLSTTESTKRAFLLKEIVDRPVGIRPLTGSFSNWD